MSSEYLRTQAATGTDIDAGLQSHMRHVYNTMVGGLAITGLVAWTFANVPALTALMHTPLVYLFILAPLFIIPLGFNPRRVAAMTPSGVQTLFFVFSAIMGISFSTIFMAYTGASIARVFFITAGTFAATSLWGYTTKKDLTGMGSFMIMGLIGIVLASLLNLFMHSSGLQFVVSVIGVLVFTGLAAWETQRIKETYRAGATEANSKVAVMGALSLYMNFINLFQSLMQLMGNRN